MRKRARVISWRYMRVTARGGVLVVGTLAAAAPLHAQTRGIWVAPTAEVETPLNTATVGTYASLGATGGTQLGSRFAFALGFADGAVGLTPTLNTPMGHPLASRLYADGELRFRIVGGSALDRAEFYLVGGGGVLRSHVSNSAPTAGPQLHAGAALAIPFTQSVGVEFRSTVGWDHLALSQVGASGPNMTQSGWTPWLRVGLAVFLRPVSPMRRIPPQAMADATVPFVSPANTAQRSDTRENTVTWLVGNDDGIGHRPNPDGYSLGVVAAPYFPVPVAASRKTHAHAKLHACVAEPDSAKRVHPAAADTLTAKTPTG